MIPHPHLGSEASLSWKGRAAPTAPKPWPPDFGPPRPVHPQGWSRSGEAPGTFDPVA